MNVAIPYKYRVTAGTFARLAASLFFCNPMVELIYRFVLARIGMASFAEEFTVITIYLLLFIACLIQPRKYIKIDSFLLLIFIVAFFGITYATHSEYEYWYMRPDYGVWPYVLFPTNALYGYVFVRLYDDPKIFLKDFKKAGWIMYAYFAYQILTASGRGYWFGVAGGQGNAQFTYSVSFGYHVMLYTLPFLYDALHNKKKTDIIAAVVGLMMIVSYGSRGPFICLIVFFLFTAIEFFREQGRSKKMIILLCGSLFSLVLYLFFDVLVSFLLDAFSAYSGSSRIILTLMEGSVTSDSGRSKIWDAAIQMIRENPWGYGAMGSQHQISKYIYAGYPHSVILEMLIDFGVIVGSVLLIFLFYHAFRILLNRKHTAWNIMFLPAFCTATGLFLSLCFWSNRAFWLCIGLGVNAYFHRRKTKQIRKKSRSE